MFDDGHPNAPAGPAPGNTLAGPFLREYVPSKPFRHTSARTTSVLFYANGGHSVVTVTGTTHHGRKALARPRTVCEIAGGTFLTMLRMELPAAGGATFFTAEVDIQWTVGDPHRVAVEVVTDVAERLRAPVLERLREVSSEFPVARAEEAERLLTRRCADGRWNDLGSELGLRIRLFVRLRTDDRTIGHVEDIREVRAGIEVTRVRQEMFRDMLRGGRLEQLAYMLAAEPAAAKEFMEKIRQEGRQDEKEYLTRLLAMVDEGRIHSHEVEARVLDLVDRGRHPLGGASSGPPARDPADPWSAGPEGFTPEWALEPSPGPPADPGDGSTTGDPTPVDRADRDPGAGHDRDGDREGSLHGVRDEPWPWGDER
ncbi:hypothetical protein [Streptomyces sp. ST2-7A]|uniref:hypothetical protein n=1 Tax=Streptomyces sp. ST2-7A TaxID=2907214 RepID=UPI001F36DA51|nr:hypothetical protein [Streptomyces sp. ST2-7A]MCE7082180.1 hypothetical protein [Streptomyces sp. ST2-7A]